MRTWVMWKMAVVVVALVMGCSVPDKHRAYFHDDTKFPEAFSAAHIGQDFEERSVVDLLSPDERGAMRRTDWNWASRDTADGNDPAIAEPGAEPSTSDKIAGTTMSLIGMGITLGAIAAPYLLY